MSFFMHILSCQNGIVSAFAYLLASTTPWIAGGIADRLINKGILSVTNVRKLFYGIGKYICQTYKQTMKSVGFVTGSHRFGANLNT